MTIHNTIDGVSLIKLAQIYDARGAVLHMIRNDSPDFSRFGEFYFSEVKPKSVKAWKRHQIQTQNFVVPVGKIRVVIFDDRSASATNGVVQVVELGRPNDYFRLQIPPNLWYGFACLGENTALLANCVDFPHDPLESERLDFQNSTIPYRWIDYE